MKKLFSLLFAAALLSFGLGPSHAAAQSIDELLDRLQQTYENRAVEAQITQRTESPFGNGAQEVSGSVIMQGDNYRVETEQQTVVTDGETVWIYTPAENQVLINDYIEDETAFSPSDFFMNYRDRYDAQLDGSEQLQGETHHVLQFEPREQDSFFQNVRAWLRDRDNAVTRLTVEDIDGTEMHFEMSNIDFGVEVAEGTFRFDAPQGAEVVDLRE